MTTMRQGFARRAIWLVGGMAFTLLPGINITAQGAAPVNTMPDAQVEANVLKALAGAPELSTQNITVVHGLRDSDAERLGSG